MITALVGFAFALLTRFVPDGGSNSGALLVGSVAFICFLAPYSFVHYLRKKRAEDSEA
jgi:Mg2+ and Co2+ transporter CorA